MLLLLQTPRPGQPMRGSGRRSRSAWRGTKWRRSARLWRSAKQKGRHGGRPRPLCPRPPPPPTARPGQWARPGTATRRPSTSSSSPSQSPPEWSVMTQLEQLPAQAGASRRFSTKSVANLTIRQLQRKGDCTRNLQVTYFLLNAVCAKSFHSDFRTTAKGPLRLGPIKRTFWKLEIIID